MIIVCQRKNLLSFPKTVTIFPVVYNIPSQKHSEDFNMQSQKQYFFEKK